MQVERYRPRRRSNPLGLALTCGALALAVLITCGAVVLLLVPRLTDIAAGSVGLARSSTTIDVLFANPTPTPVQVFNATSPTQVNISIPDYGTQTIAVNPALYPLAIGQSAEGAPLMTAQVTEDAALQLCRQYTPVCQNADPRLQNIALDFRSGGALVSADVTLPELGGITQRISAVLLADNGGTRLRFAGVEIAGALYDVPSGELASQITQFEQVANQILLNATIGSDGQMFQIDGLQIDDNRATLVLR